MKIAGWILLVLGILNLVVFFIGVSISEPRAVTNLRGAILFGVLGAFLISRGNKKEQEKRERDKWSNS